MTQLITNFYRYITLSIVQKPISLNLHDFKQIQLISDDTWNNIPNGYIKINFYDKLNENQYAGYIAYRSVIGQVGLFVLEPDYRNRGLGKQILSQTINHMKEFNTTHIWAVTIENHEFWSNVFNKSFQWHDMKELHPSVSGSGYKMKI